jgi:hypothetical protein
MVKDPKLALREDEVPREGARATRAYQLTRWIDGTTLLWLGRRKGVGRVEGSSGLRFDTVELTRSAGRRDVRRPAAAAQRKVSSLVRVATLPARSVALTSSTPGSRFSPRRRRRSAALGFSVTVRV